MGVMRKYYNDSLAGLSSIMDVFLVSAFPIINKKASQPSSLKTSNCLLLVRLLSTRGHPLSCKRKQESAKCQHYREWVVRYVNTSECTCVRDVCEHMCMHIHVCDQWTVTQLHIPLDLKVRWGCSIMMVYKMFNNNSTLCLEYGQLLYNNTYPQVNTNHNHKQSVL